VDLPPVTAERANEQLGGEVGSAHRALAEVLGWTASEWGSRFVDWVSSVVQTFRQQGHHILEYLTACFQAQQAYQRMPSLLPQPEPPISPA
jgi:hypothetical protein